MKEKIPEFKNKSIIEMLGRLQDIHDLTTNWKYNKEQMKKQLLGIADDHGLRYKH